MTDPIPIGPDALTASARFALAAPLATVRSALLPVIRHLAFTVEVEQFSRIEASRGSALAGLTMTPSRVPLRLAVDLHPEGNRTVAVVVLVDAWTVPGARGGAQTAYREAFETIQGAVDTCLTRLEPRVESSGWQQNLSAPTASYQTSVVAKVEGHLSKGTDRVLQGREDPRRRSAMDVAGMQLFEFVSGDQVARVGADEVDGMLMAGLLIAARTDSMPPRLHASVQQVVLALEDRLAQARSGHCGVAMSQLELTVEQVPVVAFLAQQAQLRRQLPMRIVHTCTTCRLERVVNPDFARMRERTRRRRVLTNSVGFAFNRAGISPFLLAGRLLQLGDKDPDFVCQRCQGLDADETMVTFCPKCGDRLTEAVLRTCPKCSFDLRSLAQLLPPWEERIVLPPPAAVSTPGAAVVPPTGAAAVPVAQPQPVPPASAQPYAPPAWYRDPTARYEFRYWDGTRWTPHVSRAGGSFHDTL